MVTLSSPSTPSPSPQSCSPAGQPQPVLVPGVVPPQVQDPALALVELHQVPLHPALQPVGALVGSKLFALLDSKTHQQQVKTV